MVCESPVYWTILNLIKNFNTFFLVLMHAFGVFDDFLVVMVEDALG